MKTFVCARCGKSFDGYGERRFCGRECANRTRAEGVTTWDTFACERCGAAVTLKPAQARRKAAPLCLPCSNARRGELTRVNRPRNMGPCDVCGAPVYRPPSEITRRFCSTACAGEARKGKPSLHTLPDGASFGVSGFRPDLGHFCRSRWEANYARYLLATGSTYQYEPHRFVIRLADGTEHAYTPDFLVDGERYVEVKGWMQADRRQAEVIEGARSQLPLPLELFWQAEYRALEAEWSAKLLGWEHRGDPKPELPKRLCPTCGKQVTSIFLKTAYCSRACSGIGQRKPKQAKSCEQCGAGFEVAPWESARRFCSRTCKHAHMKGKVPAHTPLGSKLPEAARLKMAATKRGQKQSEEHKAAIRAGRAAKR